MKTAACVLFVMLAACSKPEPPGKERPVEPQARQPTGLGDAVRAPVEIAARVDVEPDAAAKSRRAPIAAAGG